jgi:hypothetical protein
MEGNELDRIKQILIHCYTDLRFVEDRQLNVLIIMQIGIASYQLLLPAALPLQGSNEHW